MATKAEEKPKAPAKITTATETEQTVPQADTLTQMVSRLSQQFNLLALLIVALFMFQAHTFYKLKNVEAKGGSGGPGTAAAAESPLSQEALLGYAKELKLDEKKFEQCLTKNETKSQVDAEMKEATSLGVQGTPGFYINGRFIGGAFPFETFKEIIDKELAGTATNICTDYSEEMQQYCSDPANLAFNPEPKEVTVGNAPVKGPKDAKITIIEYSDFECPFCQRAFQTVEQVLEAYPKDVKLAYKQLPLTSLHPNAFRAAEASLCANKQGKFWEYHDKMFLVQLGQ